MGNCILCKNNVANKTGSHIIPSFLMKRINGNGMRDHEIGFEIRKSIVNTYFGRDIDEDKRRDITDNEDKIDSRDNYDVEDYIFCKECEDYFGSLESKYAKSLGLPISAGNTITNRKASPTDALLFWCSIVWRVSATKHLGISLSSELEEKLRLALVSRDISYLGVKYALFRSKDYSKKTGAGTFASMDVQKNSILLFVDEYILAMFFAGTINYHVENCAIEMNLNEAALNDGTQYEIISYIPAGDFSSLVDSIIYDTVGNMNLIENIQCLHKSLFGVDIPEVVLKNCIDLVLNTGKLGDRYTVNHYAWCYKETLRRHGLVLDNEDGTFRLLVTNSNEITKNDIIK